MVDIKELMRTYVFLNDPDVKEVTTKFGAVIVALGVASLAVWGSVAFFADDQAPEPTASTANDDTATDCVHESEADDWRQEHQDVLLSNRLVETEQVGDEVCFTYQT